MRERFVLFLVGSVLLILLGYAFAQSQTRPLVLAYYYPWYGKEWEDSWEKTVYHPLLRNYSSFDNITIDQHVSWAEEYGIGGFIVSWWDELTFEDNATKILYHRVNGAFSDFRLAIMVEQITNETTVWRGKNHTFTDVNYRNACFDTFKYIIETHYKPYKNVTLKYNDRFVIVLFAFEDENSDLYDYQAFFNDMKIKLRSECDVAVSFWSLQTMDCNAFDLCALYLWKLDAEGWPRNPMQHGNTYECKSGAKVGCVFPMYNDSAVREPSKYVNPDDGKFYRDQWNDIKEFRPDVVLITSWNEWHESTSIEPQEGDFGYKWLHETGQYIEDVRTRILMDRMTPYIVSAISLLAIGAVVGKLFRKIRRRSSKLSPVFEDLLLGSD